MFSCNPALPWTLSALCLAFLSLPLFQSFHVPTAVCLVSSFLWGVLRLWGRCTCPISWTHVTPPPGLPLPCAGGGLIWPGALCVFPLLLGLHLVIGLMVVGWETWRGPVGFSNMPPPPHEAQMISPEAKIVWNIVHGHLNWIFEKMTCQEHQQMSFCSG